MQEVWQKWTDNAVSKTINMHNEASIDDIINAYNLAWKSGLKGITVYRDGSKLFQILNK
jgi:ribonucleoside-diphosphate reductase alpha chain